tara:strand:- start:159 stop:782 length:624 start_codon:yes stop_codon:yes gene_type:complete
MPDPNDTDNLEVLMSSTDPKIWGENVTKQTIVEMVRQGHFGCKSYDFEKIKQAYGFLNSIIMDTVKKRYPSIDHETIETIQDELSSIYVGVCMLSDAETEFGTPDEYEVKMKSHYSHARNLNFDAILGWVEITGEIDLAVVDALVPIYGADSHQMEDFAHSYHKMFSILRERFDLMFCHLAEGLSDGKIKTIGEIRDRTIHYHSRGK